MGWDRFLIVASEEGLVEAKIFKVQREGSDTLLDEEFEHIEPSCDLMLGGGVGGGWF